MPFTKCWLAKNLSSPRGVIFRNGMPLKRDRKHTAWTSKCQMGKS